MIVVDASVIVEFLLGLEASDQIEARLFGSGENLHAPHLIDVEVAQALRRLAMRGEIDADRGRDALTDLVDMPIRRYPHGWLVPFAWSLRENVSAYDAVYVALADALDAPLLTRDRRLGSAVDLVITVEVL